MAPLKVLLVDDYEPFRRFVRLVLQIKPELQIVGEASDGLEAVQKARDLHPDLILLDVGLPKLDGIKAARRIRSVAPRTAILFVSQESSSEIVLEALSTGGMAYILKSHARPLEIGDDLMTIEIGDQIGVKRWGKRIRD
jgi:DNA-binding NarL/FixJ family response regulator